MFKPGDRVMCIKESPHPDDKQKGKVFTVESISNYGRPGVYFKELFGRWSADRFKKVSVRNKPDRQGQAASHSAASSASPTNPGKSYV